MARSTNDAAPPGMKWIGGGEFAMGSDAFYAEERPVHRTGTTINGRDHHPVVQVAYEDAEAYATWAGKKLPSEA
jgi:formylglycine-generating enzyme required for sulfatase activity